MSISDAKLREAVDAMFAKYETDGNQSLDYQEGHNLINDALTHMNIGRQVSPAEVKQFIMAVDTFGDEMIQKPELFEIFKKMLNDLSVLISTHISILAPTHYSLFSLHI